MKDWVIPLASAQSAPIPEGARSAVLMRHGTMSLRYYQPRGLDAHAAEVAGMQLALLAIIAFLAVGLVSLLYVGRSKATMPYADELTSRYGDRVRVVCHGPGRQAGPRRSLLGAPCPRTGLLLRPRRQVPG